MLELIHEFETVTGETARLTLRNTMRQNIRFRVMAARFAPDGSADESYRSDFCWIAAHVVAVEGTKWRPVDEHATPEKFDQSYLAFADLVSYEDGFIGCVQAVNRLKARTDEVEKPDAALTKDEEADPNS